MITIQVTNEIPDRDLTAQELQTVRYVYNRHVDTNGNHCYIEFGDETSTDTAVIAAYADIQTQLENEETNPDGVFFRNVLNQTPDSQILRMMQHITAASNTQL